MLGCCRLVNFFILGDNLLRVNFFSHSEVLAGAMNCKLGGSATVLGFRDLKTSLADEITCITQERDELVSIRKWQFINL